MKKFVLSLVAIMLFSPVLLAGDAKAPAGKTHEMANVQIVSVDAAAKTITIKGDAGDKTVPCMGDAVEALKTVKAGDTVTLTCQDNEKGEHQGCVGIKPAPAK